MIRRHPRMAIFTVAYTLAALARTAATGNLEFLLYIMHMLILVGLVMWADRRARFSPGVLWGLSLWGFLHLAGGTVSVPVEMAQVSDADKSHAVLYGLWLIPPDRFKYDNLVHAYGFFIATLALWQSLRRFLAPGARLSLAFAVTLVCAGMGLGAVNEIIEFAATRLLPRTGVGDYANNALDLVYNAIGAATATAIVWRRWRGGLPRARVG